MNLEITVNAGGNRHFTLTGSPMDVLQGLRASVMLLGTWDVYLSWPIGAGQGGIEIPAGQSFDDAIQGAHAELQDPDLVFDDPAEEDMARAVIGALHCALILDGAEVVVDDGDYSEDAGARYDRYDELEEPESYN